jgi:DNA-binding IclR family transcriptional regulator
MRVTAASDAANASLRLLSLLCRARHPLSLDDVMRETGLAARQAQNSLRALEAEGFAVAAGGSGLYLIGPKFLHLAKLARSNHFLEQEVRPLLKELADATGETVTFNTYAPGATYSLCVIVEESPAPLHYAVEVGEVKPLHAGSSGRAILAYLSEAEIEAYIEKSGLPAFTSRTITDPEKLRRELTRIRKQGYAMSRGHRVDGAVAIVGSVFDSDGKIYASIVVTTPSYRFRAAQKERIVELVTHAARRISSLVVASDGQ